MGTGWAGLITRNLLAQRGAPVCRALSMGSVVRGMSRAPFLSEGDYRTYRLACPLCGGDKAELWYLKDAATPR